MRLFIENIFTVAALVGTEAWFLHGYFAGQPDFEPAIAFIAAVGIILAKEPLKAKFSGISDDPSHDQSLFQKFLVTLPTEPTVRLLKEQDFGDSFRKKNIDPLFEFSATWGNVENEFIDPKLEKEKKSLLALANQLVNEIAARTVPVGSTQGNISVFSDQLRATGNPRPPNVLEDARVLNAKASEFVPRYEAFVRTCRAKLTR